MELIQGLKTRRSQVVLDSPGPTQQQIHQAMACAIRAPDHGRLQPWRFHLVVGDVRNTLGELFVKSSKTHAATDGRELTAKQLEKIQALPFRAPLIIVATMKYRAGKIPKLEQSLAVGSAVQNLQLAFHAMGYGSIWRTGEFARHPQVRTAFELAAEDELIAFLYVGSCKSDSMTIPIESDVAAVMNEWGGSPKGPNN